MARRSRGEERRRYDIVNEDGGAYPQKLIPGWTDPGDQTQGRLDSRARRELAGVDVDLKVPSAIVAELLGKGETSDDLVEGLATQLRSMLAVEGIDFSRENVRMMLTQLHQVSGEFEAGTTTPGFGLGHAYDGQFFDTEAEYPGGPRRREFDEDSDGVRRVGSMHEELPGYHSKVEMGEVDRELIEAEFSARMDGDEAGLRGAMSAVEKRAGAEVTETTPISVEKLLDRIMASGEGDRR